ncbi:MAG: hypothetical protein WA949_23560 [Phormidesmis sp.]
MQSSLSWLREQGIEELETNLLRIKLSSGIQAASKNYEEKILSASAKNTGQTSFETHQQIEARYQNAIALIDAAGSIEPVEALEKIDQLASYYDRVREEMSSGSRRTRLMTDISSTMWALAPKTRNFPLRARLNSHKSGERLSAYKYLEWYPLEEYADLLLSRAVGILETPFGQYAALLALRRLVSITNLTPAKKREMTNILNWSANIDYLASANDRHGLIVEIVSTLSVNS